MLDPKELRKDPALVAKKLAKKYFELDLQLFARKNNDEYLLACI